MPFISRWRFERGLDVLPAGDLAANVPDQPAEPGAQDTQLPTVAVELFGVGIAPRHHRRALGDTNIRLPQPHPVLLGDTVEPIDRRMQQLGVGREGDVLGLHGGVDGEAVNEDGGDINEEPHDGEGDEEPSLGSFDRMANQVNSYQQVEDAGFFLDAEQDDADKEDDGSAEPDSDNEPRDYCLTKRDVVLREACAFRRSGQRSAIGRRQTKRTALSKCCRPVRPEAQFTAATDSHALGTITGTAGAPA